MKPEDLSLIYKVLTKSELTTDEQESVDKLTKKVELLLENISLSDAYSKKIKENQAEIQKLD